MSENVEGQRLLFWHTDSSEMTVKEVIARQQSELLATWSFSVLYNHNSSDNSLQQLTVW